MSLSVFGITWAQIRAKIVKALGPTGETIMKGLELAFDVIKALVTGGPAVGRAALRSPKRANVAGPGNPPVVVDETADLDNAARSIVLGGAYDNNLLCIGEKEVLAVAAILDELLAAMERHKAVRLDARQVAALTKAAGAAHIMSDHHRGHL